MSGSYCCFRLEMNKKRKYQNELIHNLRRGKKINHQINNNRNFVNFKGVNYSFNKNNDKETEFIYDELKKSTDEVINKHIKLHKENKNYSFNHKKQQSFTSGILYFSNSINDIFNSSDKMKREIWKRGNETIEELRKSLDTKVLYTTLHSDEGVFIDINTNKEIKNKNIVFDEKTMRIKPGRIHIQFHLEGFNSKGESINIKKNGELIQDIRGKNFVDLGFGRGEKKSEKKHLSIDDYKKMSDELENLKLENKKVQFENDIIKIENEKIKEENERLNENIEELKKIESSFISLNNELINEFNTLIDNLSKIRETEKIEDILRLSERYIKNENKEKLENLLNKYQKIYISISKKEDRKKVYEDIKKVIKEMKEEKPAIIQTTTSNSLKL